MTLFLFSFLLIYGLMHGYVFLKARAAFPFGPGAGIPLVLFMLFMILAPVGTRILERQGAEAAARALSWAGYLWLAFLFFMVLTLLLVDLYRGLVAATGFVARKELSGFVPGVRVAFLVALVLSLAVTAYGYFEALHIRAERVVIETDRLPDGVERFKICQITDVHLGLLVREERLSRMLAVVREEKPDLLVSTGDLVDGPLEHLPDLREQLREIRPAYGKYAVTGNHEFYAGLEKALAFTENAGFKVLRGESRNVGGLLTIAGVDDPAGRGFTLRSLQNGEKETLAGLSRERFVLFLKHRPVVEEESLGLFDLQLSGHTHRGQIFPFNFIVNLYFPTENGIHDLGHSHVYVSRGSGTWGPPVRFLAPPEVTVIELLRRKSGENRRGVDHG